MFRLVNENYFVLTARRTQEDCVRTARAQILIIENDRLDHFNSHYDHLLPRVIAHFHRVVRAAATSKQDRIRGADPCHCRCISTGKVSVLKS